MWRRGSAPLPRRADHLLAAGQLATRETLAVMREGYRASPDRENALFNMLAAFALTFGLARGATAAIRSGVSAGVLANVVVADRHIHHYVPGIVLAFGAGAAAILTDNEELEPRLATVFGAGMGLTLDESALLLELDDVYWSREGIISVQITLALISLMGALTLALRFLRRGEQVVLDSEQPAAASAQPVGTHG